MLERLENQLENTPQTSPGHIPPWTLAWPQGRRGVQPGGRKGWHSSGMPAAAGTGRWAPAAPTPLGAGSGPPGLSLLGKGTASCWGTGTSSLCPLGVSFPPQGKLRHRGLGQSKAASLPLALAGVLAFGTSLILYPAAISGPRQGNTPLILEGLNPAEGSSFPAASSHQRHLGHPRHTQSRVSLLPPPDRKSVV